MAKYLITGGSGFIGSNLIRNLINQGDHELTLLTRNDSDLWRINDFCLVSKCVHNTYTPA